MKKHSRIIIFAVLVLTGASAGSAFAADPMTKLGRGVANVFEAPFEIYVQTELVPAGTESFLALVEGTLRGVMMFFVREVSAVYDIVTFPIPLPLHYEPLVHPATPFTNLEERKKRSDLPVTPKKKVFDAKGF